MGAVATHPEPHAPMHPLELAFKPTDEQRSSRSAKVAWAKSIGQTRNVCWIVQRTLHVVTPHFTTTRRQAVDTGQNMQGKRYELTWLPAHEEHTCAHHNPTVWRFQAAAQAQVAIVLTTVLTLMVAFCGAGASADTCVTQAPLASLFAQLLSSIPRSAAQRLLRPQRRADAPPQQPTRQTGHRFSS